MTTTDNKIIRQVNVSANAMLMLNASCQGIVEAYIPSSANPWYPILENELVTAQRLVRGWRTNGSLYFNQYVLDTSIACGQNFTNNKTAILTCFDTLIKGPDDKVKAQLIALLNQVAGPISNLNKNINDYLSTLRDFGINMQSAEDAMAKSVKDIQSQEAKYESEIQAINAKIANLQQQIQTDRDAIAKAKSEETRGIVETIFGVIFAPFTGGLSLILAGIGVASIADAEAEVKSMQASINNYQGQIQGDQQTIADDVKQVAVLQGLIMPVTTAIQDCDLISNSLDQLKVLWQEQDDDLDNIITKITKAENTQEYIVGKAWFNAACEQWEAIHSNSQAIKDAPRTTVHIQCP